MDKKRVLPHIPNDLIALILPRLTVKSLLRFKCVSKFFFSFISDPQFIKHHFDLVASPTHRLFYLAYTDDGNYAYISRSVDLSSSSLLNNSDAVTLIPPSLPLLRIRGIWGSCNGFILLCHLYSHLCIWNPSTGAHKKLPLSPNALYGGRDPILCGFWYDASTDDYLVILAYIINFPLEGLRKVEYELFSLRANAWNKSEGNYFPYYLCCLNKTGILLNGVLHWLAYRHVETRVILAFDINGRSFSEVPLPSLVVDLEEKSLYYGYSDLWVVDGYLCLSVPRDNATEIWVMNEYKVQSSWKKIVELSMTSEVIVNPIDCDPKHFFSPRYSTKCGDIVGVNDVARVVKYNAKGQLLEHHSYHDDNPRAYKWEAIMYTESLRQFPS